MVFFKTAAAIEPVAFVKEICEAALAHRERKRTRFAKRFSPMTLMGRASEEGLEKVAREVLSPYFHREPFRRYKVRALFHACELHVRNGMLTPEARSSPSARRCAITTS